MLEVSYRRGTHKVVGIGPRRGEVFAEHAWAKGTAKIIGSDLISLHAWERSRCVADCCRDVRVKDEAFIELRGYTVAHAFDHSTVHAKDTSIVFAYDDVEITAEGRAVVIIEGWRVNQARVKVLGANVLVIDRRIRSDFIVNARDRRKRRAIPPVMRQLV